MPLTPHPAEIAEASARHVSDAVLLVAAAGRVPVLLGLLAECRVLCRDDDGRAYGPIAEALADRIDDALGE